MTAHTMTTNRGIFDEAMEALGELEERDEDAFDRLGAARNVPLGTRTYIGVGGPAKVFLAPEDPAILAAAIERLAARGVPFEFLGAGSNLLVPDEGPQHVVVSTEELMPELEIESETVVAGAGWPVP